MSERSAVVAQDYTLVPAASVDADRLLAFDAVVRPQRQPRDRILASWWRSAAPECAIAAIHTPSGAMVGICGGRPSTWIVASRSIPATAICEWFVDPAHFGKGIGKRMVQQFDAPGRFLYTFVISEAAIANFDGSAGSVPTWRPCWCARSRAYWHLPSVTPASSSRTTRSPVAISKQLLLQLWIASKKPGLRAHTPTCGAMGRNCLGGSRLAMSGNTDSLLQAVLASQSAMSPCGAQLLGPIGSWIGCVRFL